MIQFVYAIQKLTNSQYKKISKNPKKSLRKYSNAIRFMCIDLEKNQVYFKNIWSILRIRSTDILQVISSIRVILIANSDQHLLHIPVRYPRRNMPKTKFKNSLDKLKTKMDEPKIIKMQMTKKSLDESKHFF